MDPSIATYVQIADKITVGVLTVVFIIALYKKGLVFGWLYSECIADLKQARTDLDTRTAKAEADLEELRRERLGINR